MTTVVRRGPIFKLGDYPDKRFALTADEAQQAIAAFQPVPIDSEHKGSVFDGKLGELQAVELRGDILHGAIAVPQWLHDLFPDGAPIPVSTTWSRGPQKQIIGLALAKNPRVSEAAMMAAFSASEGASTDDLTTFNDDLAEFLSKRHSTLDQKHLDAAHDALVKGGATCPGTATMHKETPMDEERQSFLKWLFGGAVKPAEITTAGFTAAEQSARASVPVDDSAEVARLKAELAKAAAARITSDATHFAESQIAAHKALPAEREAIIAAFTQAAQDDGQHGAVTFADGKTSSRVEQLTAMFAARPAHTLTTELIVTQNGKAGVGFAGNKLEQPRTDGAEKPMTPERRKELLGLTDLGRDVLKNGKH